MVRPEIGESLLNPAAASIIDSSKRGLFTLLYNNNSRVQEFDVCTSSRTRIVIIRPMFDTLFPWCSHRRSTGAKSKV